MPSSQPSWIIWRTFYLVLKIRNFLSVKNTCLDHAYCLSAAEEGLKSQRFSIEIVRPDSYMKIRSPSSMSISNSSECVSRSSRSFFLADPGFHIVFKDLPGYRQPLWGVSICLRGLHLFHVDRCLWKKQSPTVHLSFLIHSLLASLNTRLDRSYGYRRHG